MIFWEDLVKASAAADKTALELTEAMHRRQMEVESGVIADLTGTDSYNRAKVQAAVLADGELAELVRRHAEARNAQIDARAELEIVTHRLNERLVEAHEANMKIAERIHGS